jgi:spore coat polysaccharide biosynthesis protein SpsF
LKIGFLITARLKSKRLKFKILKPLNGFTVIERIIQRAKQINNPKDIIICTSKIKQDLPLTKIAKKNKVNIFKGSSKDVLKRLLKAAELYKLDYFLGITADNPLFSIDHAKLIFKEISINNSIDFIITKKLPIGTNIYAIKTKALKTVCKIKRETDTEIWGYLINRPEIFNVKTITVNKEYQNKKYRMTLDEIEDYYFFLEIYNKFPKNKVLDLLEVYDFLKKNPEIANINKDIIQRDLDKKIKTRINKFYKDNKKKIMNIKKKIYFN